MDSWLKAAVEGATKLGDQVQKHASELGQNASLLAEGMLVGIDGAPSDGTCEFVFEAGPLGFILEGTQVTSVDPDGQAAKLGVQVGYRLKAVSGYEVPAPAAPGDEAGEKRNRGTVKKWLKDMPRPGCLTFSAPEASAGKAEAGAVAEASVAAPVAALSNAEVAPEAVGVATSAEDSSILEELRACAAAPPPAVGAAAEPDGAGGAEGEVEKLMEQIKRLRDQVCSLERELDKARSECQELRHLAAEREDEGVGAAQSRLEVKVRGLQEQLASAHNEGEASRRKAAELQAQLAAADARCEELRLAMGQDEEHVREAFEGRERVLEDEVARLRKALSAAEAEGQTAREAASQSVARAEERVSELQAKAVERQAELRELTARATAAEGLAEGAGLELLAVREAHAVELAALREEQREALRDAQERLEEGRRAAGRELEEARRQLEEARSSASEAASASQENQRGKREDGVEEEEDEGVFSMLDDLVVKGKAEAAASNAEPQDVAVLHDRINFLEGRCGVLQKKLNARPIVFRAPAAGGGAPGRLEEGLGAEASQPTWEPLVRGFLGARAAAIAVVLYGAPDRKLRSFTQRLLRHNAWLWVFYAHLLVLYAVAASCYAQATSDPSGPVDSLNVRVQEAASAAGAAAGAPR